MVGALGYSFITPELVATNPPQESPEPNLSHQLPSAEALGDQGKTDAGLAKRPVSVPNMATRESAHFNAVPQMNFDLDINFDRRCFFEATRLERI